MRHSTNIALVPVYGELTARTASAVRAVCDNLISRGCRRIVLNMAGVPYVDSGGMSFLVVIIRRMRDANGLLSLVNVTPGVLRRLRISRIDDLVPVSVAGEHRDVQELDSSELPLWRTTLPVDGNNMQIVRGRVAELAERMRFSKDEIFDLTLAVGEAIGNATDHTCGEGILATVSGYRDRIVIDVTDCGEGFDADAVALGCDVERGRGIALMRLLVDSVSIRPRQGGAGTLVHLVKLSNTPGHS